MGEGDNAPIGGGYMPLYAPQIPLICVYIIYIILLYYDCVKWLYGFVNGFYGDV